MPDRQAPLAESAAALAELFKPTMEQSTAALKPFMDTLRRCYASALELVVQIDPVAIVPVEEREEAFRQYAEVLNWRRPHRKTSWRRLNRDERQRAALAWLERTRAEDGFGRFVALEDARASRKQGAFARKRRAEQRPARRSRNGK